jgi:hypothetical protein
MREGRISLAPHPSMDGGRIPSTEDRKRAYGICRTGYPVPGTWYLAPLHHSHISSLNKALVTRYSSLLLCEIPPDVLDRFLRTLTVQSPIVSGVDVPPFRRVLHRGPSPSTLSHSQRQYKGRESGQEGVDHDACPVRAFPVPRIQSRLQAGLGFGAPPLWKRLDDLTGGSKGCMLLRQGPP